MEYFLLKEMPSRQAKPHNFPWKTSEPGVLGAALEECSIPKHQPQDMPTRPPTHHPSPTLSPHPHNPPPTPTSPIETGLRFCYKLVFPAKSPKETSDPTRARVLPLDTLVW